MTSARSGKSAAAEINQRARIVSVSAYNVSGLVKVKSVTRQLFCMCFPNTHIMTILVDYAKKPPDFGNG